MDPLPDALISTVLGVYSQLKYAPNPGQFTVLAAFILTDATGTRNKVISLATGTKCLPTAKYPVRGEALHDSHAEVLARRGAVRWLLEEVTRCSSPGSRVGEWLVRSDTTDVWKLRDGLKVWFYVSTLPCGDASTLHLASLQAIQAPSMAALKDASRPTLLLSDTVSRGRDNYGALSVLRTKPGRSDSPPTLCLSCSDKICRWNVLGIVGALGSDLIEPIYIDQIVIGDIGEEYRTSVRRECERAFWGRVQSVQDDLKGPHRLAKPQISFTSIPFVHSREAIGLECTASSNESLSYVAKDDSEGVSKNHREVLINGVRRGIPAKHRFQARSRPSLCKVSLMDLYNEARMAMGMESIDTETTSYYSLKRSVSRASGYDENKNALVREGTHFEAWRTNLRSGEKWEGFGLDGELLRTADESTSPIHV